MNRDPRPRLAPESSRAFFGLFAAALCSASGCSNSLIGSAGPVLYGHVTHNGVPLSDGFVIFEPEVSELGPVWGVGNLGSDGSYRITKNDRGFTLDAGWYRVAVRPELLSSEGETVEAEIKPVDGAGRSRRRHDRDEQPNVQADARPSSAEAPTSQSDSAQSRGIPRMYHKPETSKLRIWVRPQPMRVDVNLLD